jgi:hypothetical protein
VAANAVHSALGEPNGATTAASRTIKVELSDRIRSEFGQARMRLQMKGSGGLMIHSRYPLTTDGAVLAAQRGAALAKTIAAVGILCGVLAIAVLASRDIQRPAEGRPRSDMSAPAAVHLAVHANPETGADDGSSAERSQARSAPARQSSSRPRSGSAW